MIKFWFFLSFIISQSRLCAQENQEILLQHWRVDGGHHFLSSHPSPMKKMSILSLNAGDFIQQILLTKLLDGRLKITIIYHEEKGPPKFKEEWINYCRHKGLFEEVPEDQSLEFLSLHKGESMMNFTDGSRDKNNLKIVLDRFVSENWIALDLMNIIVMYLRKSGVISLDK